MPDGTAGARPPRACRPRAPALPVALPALVVDPAVGEVGLAGERKLQRAQRSPQCGSFGLVEVEKGAIDVEEDGSEAVQGLLGAVGDEAALEVVG